MALWTGQDKMGRPFDFGSNMTNHEEQRYLDGWEGVSDTVVYTLLWRGEVSSHLPDISAKPTARNVCRSCMISTPPGRLPKSSFEVLQRRPRTRRSSRLHESNDTNPYISPSSPVVNFHLLNRCHKVYSQSNAASINGYRVECASTKTCQAPVRGG